MASCGFRVAETEGPDREVTLDLAGAGATPRLLLVPTAADVVSATYDRARLTGIASTLPSYTVAIGTLWIKEVGCHSLLRVASIHHKFGRTVRALRAKAGYSQESFADVIHIHRTSMGVLERGEGNPTLDTIVKIARGLDVSLTELFLAVEKDPA
jgi:DNA-binding XRE family transcriptional regulator